MIMMKFSVLKYDFKLKKIYICLSLQYYYKDAADPLTLHNELVLLIHLEKFIIYFNKAQY